MKKKKAIVWHKKKNKFINASLIKPHQSAEQDEIEQAEQDRQQSFAKSLSKQIKKAVKDSSD